MTNRLNSKYIATFPAGCWGIIVKDLKSFKLDELKIFEHDDSAVIFESTLTAEKLIELRYFARCVKTVVLLEINAYNLGVTQPTHLSAVRDENRAPKRSRTTSTVSIGAQVFARNVPKA